MVTVNIETKSDTDFDWNTIQYKVCTSVIDGKDTKVQTFHDLASTNENAQNEHIVMLQTYWFAVN